jgi:hypothetical protein
MNKANHMAQFVARQDHSLIAVSLGATFFGVPTPSFFGFIFKFAAPVLLPIFALLSILFFRK